MALVIVILIACMFGIIKGQEDCPASTTTCPYKNIGFYKSSNNQVNHHYYIGGLFGVHEHQLTLIPVHCLVFVIAE